jgi:hypothetical protein
MRQDVMVYYNDQIMENLIKAKNDLPFVHVDIQSLTSAGASQITGTVGYGETITNTGTRPAGTRTTTDTTSATPSHVVASTVGIMGMVAHAAMRPFTYSVTPLRSETLTITASPALGAQTVAAAASTTMAEPTLAVTKKTTTEYFESPQKPTTVTKEETLKPPSQPTPRSIYDLYEEFAKKPSEKCKNCKGYLSDSPTEPKQGTYVPGTLKKWRTADGTEYYFIANANQQNYYRLCKNLFTKAQTGSLEQTVQEIRGELRSFIATPPNP